MNSRLRTESTSSPGGHPLVAAHTAQTSAQTAKGAGETNLDDIKQDGEYPVCFELMGMGDLEVVDVGEAGGLQGGLQGPSRGLRSPRAPTKTSTPYAAWEQQGQQHRPECSTHQDTSFMSFCSADWAPSEDSSDAEDYMKARMQECCVSEGLAGSSDSVEDAECRAVAAREAAREAAAVRSKLSVAKVVQVSIEPEQSAVGTASTCGRQGQDGQDGQVRAQVHLRDAETRRRRGSDVVDVEGDGLDEDDDDDDEEESRGAPTPDNTPEHSPSEEHQPGGLLLGLESGSALYSTLRGMALGESRDRDLADYADYGSSTPSPACSPETSPSATPAGTLAATASTSNATSSSGGGSTLGRVWSLILGRAGKAQGAQGQGSPAPAPPRTPRLSDSAEEDLEDQEDSADDDALYVDPQDPQAIEELEATLEEVRLDGDGDDPVVSYLVEEAEDAARSPGTASRDVTVEEVHEDDGGQHCQQPDDNPQRDDIEHLDDVHDVDDPEVEGCESRTAPAPKPSGLLSRIFSRSKTSQDITRAEPDQPDQPPRRLERGAAVKRAKGEVSNSDRLLHRHRTKPRQTNKAAMRGSLSRILGRWLRQGGQGPALQGLPGVQGPGKDGAWGVGAEGDVGKGDSGLSPACAPLALRTTVTSSRRSALLQPPPLQSVRRAKTHTLPQALPQALPVESPPTKYLEDDSTVGEKLLADFASQTDESLLARSASLQSQKDSRSLGKGLKESEDTLTDVLGFI